jgi:glycosidase
MGMDVCGPLPHFYFRLADAHHQIDHSNPAVEKELIEWGTWALKVRQHAVVHCIYLKHSQTTGASGFRLDSIKHIDRIFLRKFVCTSYRDERQRN